MSSASMRMRTSLTRSARPSASTKRSRSVVATNFLLVGGRCADTKARNCLPPPESGENALAEIDFAAQKVLVDLAVEADREAHVVGIEVLSAVDDHPDFVRRAERGEHLGVDAFIVDGIRRVDRVATLHQHPPAEI